MNYIGIDGSGKYTKLIMLDNDKNVMCRHNGGNTNLKRSDYSIVSYNLQSIVSEAFLLAYQKISNCRGVCFACNDAIVETGAAQIIKMLKSAGFLCSIKVIGESRALVSAKTTAQPGILLTSDRDVKGYIFLRDNDEYHMGNYGLTIETGGSTHSIGLNALRRIIRAYDGRSSETLLMERIKKHFSVKEVSDIIDIVNNPDFDIRKISELAPLVKNTAADGDQAAVEIEKKAATELSEFAYSLISYAQKQSLNLPLLLGGVLLTSNESINRQVVSLVRAKYPNTTVMTADEKPELGAAYTII